MYYDTSPYFRNISYMKSCKGAMFCIRLIPLSQKDEIFGICYKIMHFADFQTRQDACKDLTRLISKQEKKTKKRKNSDVILCLGVRHN